ncbi:FecR family protein [Kerstersia gyiorum]|uniref:FecR family protein n=1 Tax=Kerstersia gyiorum TaxID=206506 RepID=A0A4Q7MEH9_9BURK|nr:FecR family protein [Kerstersia gyiorum]KAB0542362.1 FecR family protein [Kerstersia gyiorum]MCR4160074.1 FecR family protein [Kerstersia gyiorum]QBR39604.1 FecR family protein [Kerstersia gyiorum]RZS65418.1 FecR family protein [Kerstersia gyiorum]
MANTPDTRIDPGILNEAAHWLLRIQEGHLDAEQQASFARWHGQSSEHQRAWRRAERLLDKMGSMPAGLAAPTLRRANNIGGASRRALLRSVAAILALAPAGWLAWQARPWFERLNADYVAGIGEQLDATLDDGTRISLNTDTVLDVLYTVEQRLLTLKRGEIYISTAPDTQQPPRPFRVHTDHGSMQALGTRFVVRQHEDHTLLAVYEGAVRITPADAGPGVAVTLQAGQQAGFTRQHVGPLTDTSEAASAWRNGLLMADAMSLPQWVAELSRYSQDTIEYAPGLRQLQLSGAFPVHDIELALQMLAQTYQLNVRRNGRRVYIGR